MVFLLCLSVSLRLAFTDIEVCHAQPLPCQDYLHAMPIPANTMVAPTGSIRDDRPVKAMMTDTDAVLWTVVQVLGVTSAPRLGKGRIPTVSNMLTF